MEKISKDMIMKIHTLRKTLNISDEDYYAEIQNQSGVSSTKDLPYDQAINRIFRGCST